MTAITVSGNATEDALASSPVTAAVLKRNIERQILAKESGSTPDGMFGIDLDAPFDERIVWTERPHEGGVWMTGTLPENLKHMRKDGTCDINGAEWDRWKWTGGCDADEPERTIRIPDRLWEVARKAAKERGVNVDDVIRYSLAEWADTIPE